MMNNNLNNGAANNNNNSNNGGFIMIQGTLTTMEAFAGTVKTAMEAHYGDDYREMLQDLNKNNGLVLTGITILKKNCNIAPTIYLNQLFEQYQEGRTYHEALVNALAYRDYLVNGSEVHIDIYDDRMEIYSPGGMPDGSLIQERDPLTVPSTRRNPVLADVFNRLGYMERKGSGFGRIISSYEFQANYSEDKKPKFRSDRYQFTVVLPNLNYGVDEQNVESIGDTKEISGANDANMENQMDILIKK